LSFRILFVIPQRSGGICFCFFACHSERSEESPYLSFVLPQMRVPHLSDGFIVAKVGIERQLDPE
jgi:hypothetical protein